MAQPHTSYIICATPRCGSTVLCEALDRTNIAGRPREYFYPALEQSQAEAWSVTSFADFYERVLVEGTTPNGVFGVKIMWLYLEELTLKLHRLQGPAVGTKSKLLAAILPRLNSHVDRLLHRAPPAPVQIPAILSQAFPNLHYIWITRRDKVRQAISLHRALQTGIWYELVDEPQTPTQEATFDFDSIEYLLHDIVIDHDAAWRQYFTLHGIEPFQVVYEELVDTMEDTAVRILGTLNIPIPSDMIFNKRQLKKQADPQSEAWLQRYYELKETHEPGATSVPSSVK